MPDGYLDDIQIENTGSPEEYKLSPDTGIWMYVDQINLLLVDAYAGTLADATFPNLSFNKILGETQLTNGLQFKCVERGITQCSHVVKNLFELLTISFSVKDIYGDGTNTFMKLSMPLNNPIVLHGEHNDYLSLTVADNLSGLIDFRATANVREETRES